MLARKPPRSHTFVWLPKDYALAPVVTSNARAQRPGRATRASVRWSAMLGSRRSLDDLIRLPQQRRWDRDAQGLGGLHVDDHLELGRLNHWEIGGLGAFENLAGVDADLPMCLRKVASIADQTARGNQLAPIVDRGQCVAGHQSNELIAPTNKERIG